MTGSKWGKSLKEQTQTTEESKADEVVQLLLPADQQTAARAEPGKGAFDNPAMAVAAQRTTVLRDVLRTSILAVRRDHFQTQFGQRLIQFVTIISLVANQALRLGLVGKKLQGFLHHVPFGDVRRRHTRTQRKSLAVNDYLQLGALAFPGQPDPFATSFGGRKGGIYKALIEVDPPFLREAAHDPGEQLPEGLVSAPKLQAVMHRGLGRKTLRQVFPLNARVQNKEDRFQHRSSILPRPPSARRLRRLKDGLQYLPVLVS